MGRFELGVFERFCTFLTQNDKPFKEKYPNLEVVLCEGTIKEVEDWLVSRVIDIGIVILPNKDMEIVPLTKGKWLLS